METKTLLLVLIASIASGCGDSGVDPGAPPCTITGDCDVDQICRDGTCQPLAVEGDPCTGADECSTGLVCRLGACMPPGQEDEACDGFLDLDCAEGLQCLEDRACHATGSPGEPCDPVSQLCDAALLCYEGTCRTTIQARFCHCLTNAFGDTYYFSLTIGGVAFPYIPTQSCSSCATIPTGEVTYSLRNMNDTEEPEVKPFTVDPSWPDAAIFGKPGRSIAVYAAACGTDLVCM